MILAAILSAVLIAWPVIVAAQLPAPPLSCEDQMNILARYAGTVKQRADQLEMKLAELNKQIADLEAKAAAANKAPAEKGKGETK